MLNDIINRAKSIITSPTNFFNSISNESGYGGPVKFYTVMLIAYSLLLGISSTLLLDAAFEVTLLIISVVTTVLVAIPLTFVGAGITHIFVSILGGKQGYNQTYKANIYSSTPSLLLGWIPIAGFMAGLYSLYLLIKGLSTLQKMSMGRAAAAVLIPIILLIIIVIVIAGAAFMTLLGAGELS